MNRGKNWLGPIFVGIAAFLWATDALFRFPAVSEINPTVLVTVEHLIALAVLAPWLWLRRGKQLFSLGPAEWVAAAFIGAGGSALATVLFTASFRYINPSVTILLQKFQPILVVVVASIFLGERPGPRFLRWASLALLCGVLLSFPDFDFRFVSETFSFKSRGALYAVGAAAIWALSTVAGKGLLKRVPADVTTFWRFFFGAFTLLLLLLMAGIELPLEALRQPKIMTALVYMGLVPGLIALLAYYRGLSSTPASVATFVELIFPVSAVALNSIILKIPLTTTQLVAGAILLFAVTRISIISRTRP